MRTERAAEQAPNARNSQAKEDVLGDEGLGAAAHNDSEGDRGDTERDRDVDGALLAEVGREGDDNNEDGGDAVY